MAENHEYSVAGHRGYENELRGNLARLARFGANLTDAHSCLIFLPEVLFSDRKQKRSVGGKKLGIGGYHSLSTSLITSCSIQPGNGLVGWISQQEKPVHISPFEHDARTLGYYQEDCELKSFIGVPVAFSTDDVQREVGVIVCDSKKSFAFSRLQGRLLEDLADEVQHLLGYLRKAHAHYDRQDDWESFRLLAKALLESLGSESVEMIRISVENYNDIERQCGMAAALEMAGQLHRLFQQALPPHFPIFQLPNGETAILLDRMMGSFYQNKFEALARHVNNNGNSFTLSFSTRPVQQAPAYQEELLKGTGTYEHR